MLCVYRDVSVDTSVNSSLGRDTHLLTHNPLPNKHTHHLLLDAHQHFRGLHPIPQLVGRGRELPAQILQRGERGPQGGGGVGAQLVAEGLCCVMSEERW